MFFSDSKKLVIYSRINNGRNFIKTLTSFKGSLSAPL